MITQIIIERVTEGWAWDVYNATDEAPIASGVENSINNAISEVEQQVWELEGMQ